MTPMPANTCRPAMIGLGVVLGVVFGTVLATSPVDDWVFVVLGGGIGGGLGYATSRKWISPSVSILIISAVLVQLMGEGSDVPSPIVNLPMGLLVGSFACRIKNAYLLPMLGALITSMILSCLSEFRVFHPYVGLLNSLFVCVPVFVFGGLLGFLFAGFLARCGKVKEKSLEFPKVPLNEA